MRNFDYYNFQIKDAIETINNEIEFYQKTHYMKVAPVAEYVAYLKKRIGTDQVEKAMAKYDRTGIRHEIKKIDMNEYIKDMDIMTFRKPWKQLKEFHKIMKIKEYIDGLEFGKKASAKKIANNKKALIKDLTLGLKNKRFIKGKSVITYDQDKMIITTIDCLDFDRKTGLYKIDWES